MKNKGEDSSCPKWICLWPNSPSAHQNHQRANFGWLPVLPNCISGRTLRVCLPGLKALACCSPTVGFVSWTTAASESVTVLAVCKELIRKRASGRLTADQLFGVAARVSLLGLRHSCCERLLSIRAFILVVFSACSGLPWLSSMEQKAATCSDLCPLAIGSPASILIPRLKQHHGSMFRAGIDLTTDCRRHQCFHVCADPFLFALPSEEEEERTP